MTAAEDADEAAKALVSTYHHRLWGEGDRAAIDAFWAPDAKVHMTGFDGTAIDVVRQDVERYFGAFTDVSTRIEHLLADGTIVTLHWSTTGRHVGRYGDIAPTNRTITMTGIDLLRIAGGRIVECWSMWDGLSVFEQMGVLKIGE
ncbi:MAG: ester cyclase [Bauldia sp.]|nr:ester cyclase [Bauldia sp.]